jgi:hypothetical protein
MSDLREIQEEVGEWSAENFGTEQPAEYPLGGAGEEAGELMHSVLKRLQSIRLDEEDVGVEAEIDAVGDIGVYLLDYLYREGIPFKIEGTVRGAAQENDIGNGPMMLLGNFYQEYGILWTYQETNEEPDQKLLSVFTMFIILDMFCELRDGIESFKQCVEIAWYGEVQEREWDSDVEV